MTADVAGGRVSRWVCDRDVPYITLYLNDFYPIVFSWEGSDDPYHPSVVKTQSGVLE